MNGICGVRRCMVTLRFVRDELLYDIKNYCYVEGDTMERGDEHAKHQVFDVGETGNIDLVTRKLDVSFWKCVDLCYPYTKRALCHDMSRENELEEDDEYVMRMSVPPGFSETTVEYLTKLIHELMVYMVMAYWMSITKPESTETWQKKAESAEHEILTTLNNRIGRVRRTLSPF